MPDDSDFDATLERLRSTLAEAAALLRSHGEEHWTAWLQRCLLSLGAYDAQAIDSILSAFGGMGSFNDLVVCASNGHTISKAEESLVNTRLDDLGSRIHADATTLRHALL